jgi:hypothetical protein
MAVATEEGKKPGDHATWAPAPTLINVRLFACVTCLGGKQTDIGYASIIVTFPLLRESSIYSVLRGRPTPGAT